MQDEKKHSWLSYTSFGSGILSIVITFSFLSYPMPRELTLPGLCLLVISVSISIIIGAIALWKKNEKKLLAIIGMALGLITGISAFLIIGFFWLITPVHPN